MVYIYSLSRAANLNSSVFVCWMFCYPYTTCPYTCLLCDDNIHDCIIWTDHKCLLMFQERWRPQIVQCYVSKLALFEEMYYSRECYQIYVCDRIYYTLPGQTRKCFKPSENNAMIGFVLPPHPKWLTWPTLFSCLFQQLLPVYQYIRSLWSQSKYQQ